MKALRRIFGTLVMTVLAFKAVATFMSWVERQDDTVGEAWIDEEEYEDA